MLETLMDYPVMTTGIVTAPTGIGTMLSMLWAGRMVGRIDSRLILMLGFGLMAASLWIMSGYTLQITEWDVAWPGFIQGAGLGFISVPLTTMTFSTLARTLRPDGTAIYNLMRNIGSSVGISVTEALLVRNTATMHSSLSAYITPGHLSGIGPSGFDLSSRAGMAALNGVLNTHAAFIGYLDDYRLMFWMILLTMPCLWLLRTHAAHPSRA
jgi:DHA2 family multidrug resistance protein